MDVEVGGINPIYAGAGSDTDFLKFNISIRKIKNQKISYQRSQQRQ
jgi:hypothetical protein